MKNNSNYKSVKIYENIAIFRKQMKLRMTTRVPCNTRGRVQELFQRTLGCLIVMAWQRFPVPNDLSFHPATNRRDLRLPRTYNLGRLWCHNSCSMPPLVLSYNCLPSNFQNHQPSNHSIPPPLKNRSIVRIFAYSKAITIVIVLVKEKALTFCAGQECQNKCAK